MLTMLSFLLICFLGYCKEGETEDKRSKKIRNNQFVGFAILLHHLSIFGGRCCDRSTNWI